MSSFVQAQPVVYGTPLGSKYPPSTAANCYYVAGCHGGHGDTFYGAAPTAVDPARCYLPGGEYDAGGYGQQRAGYGGRYEQQQEEQQHRMFMSEYQPPDVYRAYCTAAAADQPLRRSGSGPSLYAGEELVRPAGDSPSAGIVPASSPAGLCSRYSPPSAPPAAVPQLGNAPQPPVIYPWMKMVHSVSGELCHLHACISFHLKLNLAKQNLEVQDRNETEAFDFQFDTRPIRPIARTDSPRRDVY